MLLEMWKYCAQGKEEYTLTSTLDFYISLLQSVAVNQIRYDVTSG